MQTISVLKPERDRKAAKKQDCAGHIPRIAMSSSLASGNEPLLTIVCYRAKDPTSAFAFIKICVLPGPARRRDASTLTSISENEPRSNPFIPATFSLFCPPTSESARNETQASELRDTHACARYSVQRSGNWPFPAYGTVRRDVPGVTKPWKLNRPLSSPLRR